MIIRRLAEGIRNQDWFVVGVEIMTVVVGLFIGLQVDDWNEDRQNRGLERDALARVFADLEANRNVLVDYLDVHRSYVTKTLDAVQILGTPAACEQSNDWYKQLHSNAASFPSPRLGLSVVEELTASGRMQLILSDEVREALTGTQREMTFFREQWQRFAPQKIHLDNEFAARISLELTDSNIDTFATDDPSIRYVDVSKLCQDQHFKALIITIAWTNIGFINYGKRLLEEMEETGRILTAYQARVGS